MRLIHCLLIMLVALLPATADANERTVLVVGDSLSAAYGMELDESWPSLLQRRLDEHGYDYRVFNSSIAGETTQGGLTRLPRLLQRERPAIVLIELGGNDGLRGLPLDVTRSNLTMMIDQSLDAGAAVVLAEMRIPPNYGQNYTAKFNATYGELAERDGVVLLPFMLQDIALDPGLMQADGIHPTAAAQPLIVDRVWAVLQPLL